LAARGYAGVSLVLSYSILFSAGSTEAGSRPLGDVSQDWQVTWEDVALFSDQWLDQTACSDFNCADFDDDNDVDGADFALLAQNWQQDRRQLTLVINEFMAQNDSFLTDPLGDYDDWIEIHNYGPVSLNIGGMYLTDNLSQPTQWQVPTNRPNETTIPSLGYLIIWADDEVAEQPGLHANFKLSVSGEDIGLFASDGSTLIDSIVFGAQEGDKSYGRFPDANTGWRVFAAPSGIPTPGSANDDSSLNDAAECVVVFNEIMYHPSGAEPNLEWIELYNQMAIDVDMSGWSIIGGVKYNFPPDTIIPGGGYLVVAKSPAELQAQTGYADAYGPFEGDLANTHEKLWLRDNSKRIMDYIYYSSSGGWPTEPNGTGKSLAKIDPNGASKPSENWAASAQNNGTPGANNGLAGTVPIPTGTHTAGSIVINEIMYNHQPKWETGGTPFEDSNEEWIELFNRTGGSVSIAGWQLEDAVEYTFAVGTTIPAGGYLVVARDATALHTKYPSITIVGNFSGVLANDSEHVKLLDGTGAVIDEVRYYSGKPWPEYAAGGGSSMELRNPLADNTRPEAWADSNERGKTSWQTYTYQMTAAASTWPPPKESQHPDITWKEFIMGLLDAGEIYIDDVNVLEDPCGTCVQFIQNGTFEPNAAHWRLGGNHSHSHVDTDPNNPANHVLHLVSTGQAEQIYNHAETTIAGGRQVTNGKLYKISFRAKWLAGSPRLNSRLYFNRTPKTTIIEPNQFNGTPGAQNSCFQSNIGPTYNYLAHSPVVPTSSQSVTVTVVAKDPNNIGSCKLYYKIGEGGWNNNIMTHQGSGKYTATISSKPARTIVQFYVEANDSLGATSTYPAAGPDSRALYKVNDGKAELNTGIHNFRIIMTSSDFNDLNNITNAYTDDLYGATVVYDENTAFYDVGVCFKGSLGSRANPDPYRKGYKVEFHPDNLFRGVTQSLTIDRAAGGFLLHPNPEHRTREILFKHILNRIGGVSTQYDDLCKFIPPDSNGANHAQLQVGHYSNRYLDSQYENGGDGMLFKHELVYYPTATIGGSPESPKNHNSGDAYYPNPPISNLGDTTDQYRQIYLLRNHRDSDDYSRLIQFAKMFQLTGSAFVAQAEQMIDLDEWMRAYAWTSIISSFDNYFGSDTPHNHFFFVRPRDNKVCFLTWDNDFVKEYPVWWPEEPPYIIKACTSLNQKLFEDANDRRYKRLYYGHINDIITTIVNADYLTYWAELFGSFIPEEDYVNYYLDFQLDRANWIMTNQFPAQAPYVPFEITTNGGKSFSTANPTVTLQGNAWINIRRIEVRGYHPQPTFTWSDPNMAMWQTTVGLDYGSNAIDFVGYDYQGNVAGSDTITVTRQ